MLILIKPENLTFQVSILFTTQPEIEFHLHYFNYNKVNFFTRISQIHKICIENLRNPREAHFQSKNLSHISGYKSGRVTNRNCSLFFSN